MFGLFPCVFFSQLPVENNTEKYLCCWLCTSGPISVSAQTDRRGYCPGKSMCAVGFCFTVDLYIALDIVLFNTGLYIAMDTAMVSLSAVGFCLTIGTFSFVVKEYPGVDSAL